MPGKEVQQWFNRKYSSAITKMDQGLIRLYHAVFCLWLVEPHFIWLDIVLGKLNHLVHCPITSFTILFGHRLSSFFFYHPLWVFGLSQNHSLSIFQFCTLSLLTFSMSHRWVALLLSHSLKKSSMVAESMSRQRCWGPCLNCFESWKIRKMYSSFSQKSERSILILLSFSLPFL